VIVLDTHTWLWWLSDPKQLSRRARTAVRQAMEASEIFISSISAWEVAMLVKKGRLRLSMDAPDWISQSQALPFVRFVPVDNAIAVRSIQLEALHPDPADRIIVATAIGLGASLVTKDEKLVRYPGVKTLW
jgi:PIN domain nuclease of toxin-antitoxin system